MTNVEAVRKVAGAECLFYPRAGEYWCNTHRVYSRDNVCCATADDLAENIIGVFFMQFVVNREPEPINVTDLPAYIADKEAFEALPAGSIIVPLGENQRPIYKLYQQGYYRDALTGSPAIINPEQGYMVIFLHQIGFDYPLIEEEE